MTSGPNWTACASDLSGEVSRLGLLTFSAHLLVKRAIFLDSVSPLGTWAMLLKLQHVGSTAQRPTTQLGSFLQNLGLEPPRLVVLPSQEEHRFLPVFPGAGCPFDVLPMFWRLLRMTQLYGGMMPEGFSERINLNKWCPSLSWSIFEIIM